MKDQGKTKQVLIQELASLKQRIAELERSESESKRIEESLRESDERYRTLAMNSPSMIFLLDLQGTVLVVNEKSAAQFGTKPDAIIGRNVRDLFSAPIAERHMQAIKKVIRDGEMLHSELSEPFPTGVRWIDARIVPVRDKSGAITAVLGISHDITERKEAEKALRDSESKYQFLAESMADVVFTLDINLVTTYVSPSMEKMLGFTPEERMAQKVDQQLTPKSQKLVFEALVAELEREKEKDADPDRSQILELEYYHKNGSIKHLVTYIRGMRDSEGNLTGFYGSHHDITDRRQAEEALRKSEGQFRLLAENARDTIWTMDMNLRYTYMSPYIKQVLDYTPEEYMAIPLNEVLTPSSLELCMQAFAEELEVEKRSDKDLLRSRTVEVEHIGRNGKIVPAEIKMTFLRNTAGQATGILGYTRDITERKRAEETLRDSKEQYRTLVENASDIVFRTDRTGHFTFINQAALRITKYEEQEILGKHYPTLIHPDMRDEVIKFFGRQFVKRIRNTYLEYPLLTKEGHKLWCGQNTQLIFEDDHVEGFQAVARDITERKQAEEELKRSEERYRTILDEIEDGYQEVDLSGNFTFFNASFRKIFGYSENELMGSNFRRYAADEETADRVYQAYNQMYKTGNPVKRFEWDIITQDGARRSIEFSAFLMRDGQGHRRGFRGIVRDVTERKSAEEQYRTMANSSQTGVYIVQDGRLCFVNPYIPIYSGYPEEELIGKQALHFVHPDDRKRVREMARKMLAGELKAPYEYQIEGKDNRVRWIMETVTPISYKGRSAVLGNTMDTTDRKRTEEELRQTLDSLRKAFGATIQVMVAAVESRDPYTAGHQIRSADLARAIATEMGLPQEKIDGIRMAGSVHDIGKLSIPAEILSRPIKLTKIEFALIKEHARIGYEILKDVESPWPLADIVYQHHERMDGSGYPRNLKGEELLMEARIMAVADVVESMASHRPYRPALGVNAAMEEIENNKGTLYDAGVTDACLRLFREKGFQLEKI
ncbi:MAG: PAS domain S-box protein [Deltaproteobacteria bacterium]|nr:PAS domain S-box protein [Deltaproteobacteria bacterium]